MKIERSDIFAMAMQALPWIADGLVAHQHHIFEGGIDTPLRLEHFMAQLAHESAHFRTTVEFGNDAYFAKYNGRRDLGNRYPGDGPRFRGHGLIQVTGRANHRGFTKWARERTPDAPDFEADPWELTKFPYCLLSAVWYWQSRRINRFADRDNIRAVTKAINGGYNGLADRIRYREKARGLFG